MEEPTKELLEENCNISDTPILTRFGVVYYEKENWNRVFERIPPFEDNNHILVSEFLKQNEVKYFGSLLNKQCMDLENIKENYTPINKKISIRNFPLFSNLLANAGKVASNFLEFELIPYCSDSDLYFRGYAIEKEKYEEECEVSITIGLTDHKWNFDITNRLGIIKSYPMKPGDAIIYKGNVCERSRNYLQSCFYSQVTLHYKRL